MFPGERPRHRGYGPDFEGARRGGHQPHHRGRRSLDGDRVEAVQEEGVREKVPLQRAPVSIDRRDPGFDGLRPIALKENFGLLKHASLGDQRLTLQRPSPP